METIRLVIALLAAEIVLFTAAQKQKGPNLTRCFVVANMIGITIFAPKLMELGGYTTNIANIFYASVVLGVAVILVKYGLSHAIKTIASTLYALMVYVTLSYLLGSFPTVEGDTMAAVIDPVTFSGIRIVGASFLAFFISNFTFINLLDRLKDSHIFLGYTLGIILLQAVDSIIFFPIAFGQSFNWHEFMIVGFMFKVIIGMIYFPVFYITTRKIYN